MLWPAGPLAAAATADVLASTLTVAEVPAGVAVEGPTAPTIHVSFTFKILEP